MKVGGIGDFRKESGRKNCRKEMIAAKNAPVVKRISQQPSELLFQVRILAGAKK